MHTYTFTNSIVFRKTNEEPYGAFSNMKGGFPLTLNGKIWLTSEALYQACRFPNHPDIQEEIRLQKSPMAAKMKSKPHRPVELGKNRLDWDDVRIPTMAWCLRVKLAQHFNKFSKILLQSGNQPIVEWSHKDQFWGATGGKYDNPPITLTGHNHLGNLLMQLRELLQHAPNNTLLHIPPAPVSNFLLHGTDPTS